MEEYLNENYRVKIDDMNITAEEGIIYRKYTIYTLTVNDIDLLVH